MVLIYCFMFERPECILSQCELSNCCSGYVCKIRDLIHHTSPSQSSLISLAITLTDTIFGSFIFLLGEVYDSL